MLGCFFKKGKGSQKSGSRFFYDIMIVKIESTRKTGEATEATVKKYMTKRASEGEDI